MRFFCHYAYSTVYVNKDHEWLVNTKWLEIEVSFSLNLAIYQAIALEGQKESLVTDYIIKVLL